ncbi:MAG: response regulator transcription factor [Dehalococcoidia bacterium]|nr:response regulator transcription factor [Dehalococcoidia bacterium]
MDGQNRSTIPNPTPSNSNPTIGPINSCIWSTPPARNVASFADSGSSSRPEFTKLSQLPLRFSGAATDHSSVQTILVVEDERDLNDLLVEQLGRAGYATRQAFDGRTAVEEVRAGGVDLILLDWMLPVLDGVSALREIRAFSLAPVLMLTARGQDIDIVNGLEAGADDYLSKPTHVRVLRARVAALLRRAGTPRLPVAEPASPEVLRHGGFVVHCADRTVDFRGATLELTPTEFDLVELLCSNPGRAFSREYLLERIWDESEAVGPRTVDTHVQRLRKKLGDGDSTIQTVWGMGYRVKAG